MTKPSEPKVWRGWAVYWPSGTPVRETIAYLRRDSLLAAERRLSPPWPELRRRGFRCRRITITAED